MVLGKKVFQKRRSFLLVRGKDAGELKELIKLRLLYYPSKSN
jgi:hypothetical protein